MKLTTEVAEIHRGGIQTEQTFTIAAKGKAFEILSSGLYTDPMLAIVRELCCNARDSHIANENPDEPFQVHLPNRLEPFFQVTDYGVGLSEHDVFHIFTTYFESTKDKSDDFIGCLGLGSKAPFSYADAFEVVSRFDGVCSTYSMFKNEVGVPSVAKMAEAPTDERNGLSVKLTIKPEDHQAFRVRLSSALKYFETKPEVVGGSGFRWDPLPEDPIRGDGWFISASAYNKHPVIAVQGGVGYRVDLAHITPNLDKHETSFISDVQIVLYFEIGEIDIPPSREEVRYDKKTVDNIVKAIKHVRLQLTPQIEQRISHIDSTSIWDGYAKLRTYSMENFNGPRSISTFVQQDQIKNKLLADYLSNAGDIQVDFGHPEVSSDRKDKLPRPAIGMGGLDHFVLRSYTRSSTRSGRLTRFTSMTEGKYKIEPTVDTAVILLDERNRAIMKLSQYARDSNFRETIAIVPNDHKTFNTNKAAQAEYQQIIEALGNPTVEKISDIQLDSDEVVVKTTTTRKSYFYKPIGAEKSASARRRWSSVPDTIVWDRTATDHTDAPTNGLYFLVHAHRTVRIGNDAKGRSLPWKANFSESIAKIVTLINQVKGTSYTPDDVWGAQTGVVRRKLMKDPNWTNIFELAGECLDEVKAVATLHIQLYNMGHFVTINKHLNDDNLKNKIRSLKSTSKFRQIIEPMIDMNEAKLELFDMVDTARDVSQALHGPRNSDFPSPHKNSTPPLYKTEDILEAYPMLTFIEDEEYGEYVSDKMFAYINLIDEQNP